MNIAIMGFGTVGRGVYRLLQANRELIYSRCGHKLCVKKILDLKIDTSFENPALFCLDIQEILDDDDITLVVECMGGEEPAYTYSRKILEAKKSLVSSNKEVAARYMPELCELAKQQGVSYLFEASVGGGMPIIRPLRVCLSANRIKRIRAILNGTSNYILSKMSKEQWNFADALQDAQKKGYAEQNPTNDIEGWDASRKLALLCMIVLNQFVDFEQISCTGIKHISCVDMEYAKQLNCNIKLLACAELEGEAFAAWVAPCFVPASSMLSSVNGVYNAVLIESDALENSFFYGKGAGQLPTASSICSDMIEIASSKEGVSLHISKQQANILPSKQINTYFVRIPFDLLSTYRKKYHVLREIALEQRSNEIGLVLDSASARFLQSLSNFRMEEGAS